MSTPTKPIVSDNERGLANDLNTFLARFETLYDHSKCTEMLKAVTPAPSDRITITEEDVRRVFQCTNTRKANGPDECSAFLLKHFASELAPVWQPIFQTSVDTHTIPLSWKTSHIKPQPKIQCPKEHKDYRPIALTSVIMKSLERILLQHLTSITKDKFDPCQFAYKKGCGTEDAVVTLVHLISKHLDKSNKNHARVLFLDFSSAFNTIQSDILVSKMVQLELNPYLIHWYASFLTNRVQMVKVNTTLSSALTTNVGAPQGCVSSAVLFTLYTDSCRTEECLSERRTDTPDQYILKYSDDTVLISLLDSSSDPGLHQHRVNKVVEWSDNNALIINTKKTEEIIFGAPSETHRSPITIHGESINQVCSYKYLGVVIDHLLSWKDHIESLCMKTKQRIYFLRRLRSFGASRRILLLFFTSVIMSVLQYCSTTWYGCLSVALKSQLLQQLSICSKIVGQPLLKLYTSTYDNSVLRLARNITSNTSHVLHGEYRLLPSGRRYCVPSFKKVRLKKSFVHQSTLRLNQDLGVQN